MHSKVLQNWDLRWLQAERHRSYGGYGPVDEYTCARIRRRKRPASGSIPQYQSRAPQLRHLHRSALISITLWNIFLLYINVAMLMIQLENFKDITICLQVRNMPPIVHLISSIGPISPTSVNLLSIQIVLVQYTNKNQILVYVINRERRKSFLTIDF